MIPRESHTGHRPWPARLSFYYGWLILPASALALFVSGPGQTFSISVFVDPLIDEFGWSRTAVSGLYTAGSLTAACAMFAVGKLLDRFGARIILTVVGALMGLAAVWMSTVNSELELYAGFAALRTFGQGSLSLVGTTLIAIWFVRRRGKLTALAGLGMMGAQAVFPPLNHYLISEYGWRDAWIILAIIVWAIAIPIGLLVVRRSPESIGVLPDGVPEHVTTSADSTEPSWTLAEAMRTRSFWLLLAATASNSLVGTALIFHQVDIFASRGIGAGISASVLGVMGPASFTGVMVAGALADRFPNRYLLTVGQLMLIAAMVMVTNITGAWQAMLYGLLLGFASGFIMNASIVIWPNYFGRSHIGSIRGVVSAMMVAAAALGPLPLSLGLDISGSYATVLLFSLVLPTACGLMAYLGKPPLAAGRAPRE